MKGIIHFNNFKDNLLFIFSFIHNNYLAYKKNYQNLIKTKIHIKVLQYLYLKRKKKENLTKAAPTAIPAKPIYRKIKSFVE